MRIILVAIVILLFGCKPEQKTKVTYDWLVGTWQQEEKDSYEVWHKINSHSYQGVGYVMKDSIPTPFEYLRLYYLDQKWNYSATVAHQNNGKTIEYVQKNIKANALFVENQTHDFPKSIFYEHSKDRILNISLNLNLPNEIRYSMRKVDDLDI